MSKNLAKETSFSERQQMASQVKRLRSEAGFTQQELAKLAGMSRQALSNIERGATPQIENLIKLYEILGVELESDEVEEDTAVWLGILGSMLDALSQPKRGEAGQAAVNAVAAVIASPNVAGISDTEHRHQSDYDLVSHPYTEETGEMMDE